MSRKIILLLLLVVSALNVTWANSKEDSTFVYRPAYHFTTQQNAMGSPVGIIRDGEKYHLFYEYNASGLTQDNYSLGHATSIDLVHWNEQTVAFTPEAGTLQGASCLVDEANVLAKLKGNNLSNGATKTWLLAYAVKDKGVKIAYSTDAGTKWQDLSAAVELPFTSEEMVRDPKLIWNENDQTFVLLVARASGGDEEADGVSFYSSKNLTDWTFNSHIRGLKGSPDLFQLPVNGDSNNKQWVLSDSRGSYMLGDFNGKSFSAKTDVQRNQGGNFNSPTTFKNTDGRIIQIASLSNKQLKGVDYCGVLTIPMELSLVKNEEDTPILTKHAAAEMKKLSARPILFLRNKKLIPGVNDNPIARLKGVSTHINGTFNLNNVDAFGFLVLSSRREEGSELMYNAKKNSLSWEIDSFPVKPKDKRMKVELFIDRSTVEIFVNGGETIISTQMSPSIGNEKYVLAGQGGELIIESLNAHKLKLKGQ